MERTGSRKYSVPRLASARGEEAARRAMPTSSVAGFVLRLGVGGGAEASLADSQVPWRAAVGNNVRLVCFARFRGRSSVAGVARRMGKVAIDCLAARVEIYSPFVRCVKHYFAFISPVQPGSMRPGNQGSWPAVGTQRGRYTRRESPGGSDIGANRHPYR